MINMNSKVIISFIISYFLCYYSYGQNAIPTRDYEVNIENDAVRQFMLDVIYEPHDSSIIDNYRKGLTYRADWPNPLIMDIPQTTVDSLLIYCCDDETLQDSLTFHVSVANGKVKVYNFIPNRIYRYQIKNGDDVLQQGKIRTSGQLRMINVCNSVSNVRDLGGWKTADNMQIRYGRIFRGTELNGTHIATEEGIIILRDLGVGAELDMRARYNEGHNVSAFGFNSIFSNENVRSYYYTSDSGQLPSDITKSKWLNTWKLEFQFIVNNLHEDRAIYEHCVHGKDRTGYLSFLLEGLLGVSYNDLVKDYEVSLFINNQSSTKDSIDKMFDYIYTMSGETLRDKFNTFFIEKLGVKQSEIDSFRSQMLESNINYNSIRDIQNDTNLSKENVLYDLNGHCVKVPKKRQIYLIKDRYGHTRKVFFQ